MLPLAFVDLETTGATAEADRITEIGIVEVGADGVSEWSSLVNPQVPISPFIERLTGISDAMVATAPTFAELAAEIRRRLDGRLFIAHNARFDYGFLKAEFRRVGVEFRATVLCTVKLSRQLEPQHHRHNLDSLIARHGLVADGRHRALADAQLIHQLWNRLHDAHPAETIAAAVGELTARPRLPPQLDAGVVEDLPSGHGVYVFFGDDGQALHVGRSRQVRKRVLAHFAGKAGETPDLALQVRRIEAIETAGEVGALLHEARLIRSLRPLHPQPPASDEETCTWRLVDRGDGLWQPELLAAEAIDFAAEHGCHGLFRNRREARRALQQIARDQRLCLTLLGLETGAAGQPCPALAAGGCRGACVGREPRSMHSARLIAALTRQRLLRWPFAGPALLVEGPTAHVIDRWRHLGSADSDAEIWRLVDVRPGPFDRDVYRLLVRSAAALQPLAGARFGRRHAGT